jgi:hypothetical protein
MKFQKPLKLLALALIASGIAATSFAADAPYNDDVYFCKTGVGESQLTVKACSNLGGQLVGGVIKHATPAQIAAQHEQEKLTAAQQNKPTAHAVVTVVKPVTAPIAAKPTTIYCTMKTSSGSPQTIHITTSNSLELKAFSQKCGTGKLSGTPPVATQTAPAFNSGSYGGGIANTDAQTMTRCKEDLTICAKNIGFPGYPTTQVVCQNNYVKCAYPAIAAKRQAAMATAAAAATKQAKADKCLAAQKSCLGNTKSISATGTGACMDDYNNCMAR